MRRRRQGGADTAATPVITSVSPASGLVSGGTAVTLRGTGFLSPGGQFRADVVTFGTARATAVAVVSATQMTCTTPAGTGTVDVRVSSPGGVAVAEDAFAFTSPDAPEVSTLTAKTLPDEHATETDVVVVGFAANARIQPHGHACTWHVEYGATTSYGSTTTARALPGKLAAYYREEWAAPSSLSGWSGSINDNALTNEGGYVRYTAEGDSSGDDPNHTSGLEVEYGANRGYIQLPLYLHWGNVDGGHALPRLGGGKPDVRGALVTLRVRGNAWTAEGSVLHTWVQANRDTSLWYHAATDMTNWAYTARDFTTDVEGGDWADLSWTLENRTDKWVYAGRNDLHDPIRYRYKELDGTLAAVDVDIFPLQNLKIDWPNVWPSGSIDFDDFQITYRQHNLCAASNGGTLVEEPTGGSGAEYLTDGWRNGSGREWQSALSPTSPQDFVYSFANPVTVYAVQIHNATTNPSKDIEVAVSEDAEGDTWTDITTGVLPETATAGSNYVFHIADSRLGDGSFGPLHANPVRRMRVRVTSGYGISGSRWGLGEIEAFGTGATEQTDDAWYDVNQDVQVASGTWHYRIVATTSEGTTYGPDQTVTVP